MVMNSYKYSPFQSRSNGENTLLPMSQNTSDTEEVIETYAEDTPLLWALGDKSKVKILAALLSEKEHDVNISDLSRLSGLSRSTIYDHIGVLQDAGLVKKTREVSNSDMFQIDLDSKGVESLANLEQFLLAQRLGINPESTDEETDE